MSVDSVSSVNQAGYAYNYGVRANNEQAQKPQLAQTSFQGDEFVSSEPKKKKHTGWKILGTLAAVALAIGLIRRGNAKKAAKVAEEAAGKGAEAAGKGAEKAAEAAGKGAEAAGKGAEAAGKGAEKAGKKSLNEIITEAQNSNNPAMNGRPEYGHRTVRRKEGNYVSVDAETGRTVPKANAKANKPNTELADLEAQLARVRNNLSEKVRNIMASPEFTSAKTAVINAEKRLKGVSKKENQKAIDNARNVLAEANKKLEEVTFGDRHLSLLTEFETELLEKIAKLKKPSKK